MKHILFVDDEPQILESLRDSLRSERGEWDMRFALGGEDALAQLADEPADVVISDMRMPGLDGAQLLERVRELRPEAARIILSGYGEMDVVLRAAAVAHVFLAKPCPTGVLKAAVERVCGLQSLLRVQERRAGNGITQLPSPPATLLALQRATADPAAGADEVAAIVQRDVAMSAKVLQLVNSAFFGIGRTVQSIPEAVRYLGITVLEALVASESAFAAFAPSRPIDGFDIEGLQRHATLTARLARRLPEPKEQAETAFTAAMLCDVGQLVLAAHRPDQLEGSLVTARVANVPLHVIEYEADGTSHAELGAYVLGLWGLPHGVVEAVAHHHAPQRIEPLSLDPVLAVQLAEQLVTECASAPSPHHRELTVRVEQLGLADRLGGWRAEAARAVGA